MEVWYKFMDSLQEKKYKDPKFGNLYGHLTFFLVDLTRNSHSDVVKLYTMSFVLQETGTSEKSNFSHLCYLKTNSLYLKIDT